MPWENGREYISTFHEVNQHNPLIKLDKLQKGGGEGREEGRRGGERERLRLWNGEREGKGKIKNYRLISFKKKDANI